MQKKSLANQKMLTYYIRTLIQHTGQNSQEGI